MPSSCHLADNLPEARPGRVLTSVMFQLTVEEVTFRATWNGAVLAETDHMVRLEGNHHFPAESLRGEYFVASPSTSTWPWKGRARYYHIRVDGTVDRDAAWYCPQPSPAASSIAGQAPHAPPRPASASS
jgi:uncharacterized protein (DUF427 family)